MFTELLFSFAVGFFAVIISSEIFIHAAKKLSLIWKISPLIVSIFIIGLGNGKNVSSNGMQQKHKVAFW